ncbi:hypothetical protein ES708_22154 [subsurface metagenome]
MTVEPPPVEIKPALITVPETLRSSPVSLLSVRVCPELIARIPPPSTTS